MQNLSRWGLVPELESIVAAFLDEFPESHMNDGKRNRATQADRMAGLVVAGEVTHAKEALPRGLSRWGAFALTGTYYESPMLTASVNAICLRPDVTDRAGLAALILAALAPFTDEQLDKLSKHLSGRAADLQRFGGSRWLMARAWWARQLRVKVLYAEAGMPRLHVQLRD